MDDKELYETLEKYAESTRSDKSVAFKKLNEKPQEEVRRSQKRFKLQYLFAAAACMAVIVLCITLPLTLTDKSTDAPQGEEPTYCNGGELAFNMEESIDVLKEVYGIYAFYPTLELDSDNMAVNSISSYNDSTLHGALLGYCILEDVFTFIDVAIIPKTHVVQIYEDYFELTNVQQWRGFELKYEVELNADTELYDMKIYFSDEKYDYFVSVNNEVPTDAAAIMDILYQ